MESQPKSVTIIGAGPAGITASYELTRNGIAPFIVEKGPQVGGISRTEAYKGYRFDIGGHRFYTKVADVQRLWHDVLGEDFITVPRLSRIFYDGKYYPYPLQLAPTLKNLGATESLRILLSYLHAQVNPRAEEVTFEDYVINRFGKRLYETFFRAYTEKVWGLRCDQIRADWAAQRIKGLSLWSAAQNAIFNTGEVKSLINEFHYPTHGPGMMWERFESVVVERGAQIEKNAEVTKLRRNGHRITDIEISDNRGTNPYPVEEVISSMPLRLLIERIDPLPPADVIRAAQALKYRDFLVVCLILDATDLFPDNWLYIHSPDVRVGRIQNFKNWSAAMVPDATKTSLGMEYFSNVGDDLWSRSDSDMLALAKQEIEQLGLASATQVEDGTVIRQRRAYPTYDEHYQHNVATIRDYLAEIDNLQTIGRNGLHRYNNQDHSMLTGLFAARNLVGGSHDLWDVNTERSYYEEFVTHNQESRDRFVAKVVPNTLSNR